MENESEITMFSTIFNLFIYAGIASVFIDILVNNTEPIRENDPNNENTKFEKMLITIKEYIVNNFCKKQKEKIKVKRKLKLDINTKIDSENEHESDSEHKSDSEHESESRRQQKVASFLKDRMTTYFMKKYDHESEQKNIVRKSRRLQNLKPEYKGFK